ncbi:hypothetical protein Pelo_18641 [Pelomyxa schiedti]|nr:hypothetical protein Pelo_18641 [Pelomyxa schiedti]
MNFHHTPSNPKEVIAFHVTPKCSSTRSHIKSKIILLVSTIPGVAPFASNSISLCSRDRNRGPKLRPIQSPLGSPEVIIPPPAVMMGPQPLRRKNRDHIPSTTAQDRDYYPSSRSKRDTDTSAQEQRVEDDSRSLVHTKSSMEYISFQTTSNRQCIVDSRSAPAKFPESMIAGIPERIFRRPVIFVFILSVKEEHFIPLINSMIALQAPYEFTLQYGKISNDLFVIGCGHKNVESFCYGIAMRCKFLTGNNPFHMDITKPNPIIKFLGTTEPSKELELCVDTDVLYMRHSYTMRLIVDAKWRQSSGISHTELSNHVLCGSWVKWGLRTETMLTPKFKIHHSAPGNIKFRGTMFNVRWEKRGTSGNDSVEPA